MERLQGPIAGEINRALEGAVLEVLVEGPSEARGGRADTTLGEAAPGAPSGAAPPAGAVARGATSWSSSTPYDPTGMLVDVLVARSSPWYLEGQLLTSARPRPAPARAGVGLPVSLGASPGASPPGALRQEPPEARVTLLHSGNTRACRGHRARVAPRGTELTTFTVSAPSGRGSAS